MPDALRRRGYVGLMLGATPESGALETGLSVRAVAPRSSAERAGLRAGDLLTHVERNPAADLNEVRQLLKALRSGDPLLLRVVRDGKALQVDAQVDAYPVEQHAGARTELGEVCADGHRLRTIAVLPDSAGPHPVVYYLPGAHWASEEHPLEPAHPLSTLVLGLAGAGIATLRVERSGVGDSEGPPCARVDFAQELGGYAAGLRYVLGAPWVDARHVFLLGHSIGAMVAPLIGAGQALAGVLTYGACAIPISEGLVGAILRHAELERRDLAGARRVAGQIAEIIREVVVNQRTPDAVFAERPDLNAIAPAHFHGDQAYGRVVAFYHQLERAELAAAWRKVGAPSLIVHGSDDWISSAEDSANLAQLIGASARYVDVPGVDHQLSDASPGNTQRLAPALFAVFRDWILDRVAKP